MPKVHQPRWTKRCPASWFASSLAWSPYFGDGKKCFLAYAAQGKIYIHSVFLKGTEELVGHLEDTSNLSVSVGPDIMDLEAIRPSANVILKWHSKVTYPFWLSIAIYRC
jgi:hypothetical protein